MKVLRFFLFCLISLVVAMTLSSTAAAPLLQLDEVPARPVYGPPSSRPHLELSERPEELIPAAPDLSPFTRIVFQSFRNLNNWEIYSARDDGGDEIRVTDLRDFSLMPRYNRGLTRIVFTSDDPENYEIFTVNPDGTGLARLTNHPADDFAPAWSFDGTRITFESERDGQSEVYVMNADGSGLTRLTNHPDYDGRPSWSPDGTKITFISRRTGGYRVYVMNADGSNPTLISGQAYSNHPVWSPDGKSIAYDADNNGDGWWEVWRTNPDGSNQYSLYQPSGTRDAWVSSWGPYNDFVAFTHITWFFYQGNWYWTEAYLDAVYANNNHVVVRLNNNDTEWYPDWQTADNQRPTSRVQELGTVSPGPIQVQWSGSDAGPSGLRNYDIQVRQGTNGAWTMWQADIVNTTSSYPGVAGQTYYFRSRARDNVYNVEAWPTTPDASTTVETLPPTTAVNPLPAFSRADNPLIVTWGGTDPGGSAIISYDVQYKVGNGTWQNWQMGTQATSAEYPDTNAGETVYFRCRATDSAQNVEAWPSGNGDTNTSFYVWSVSGTIQNNREAPVTAATVQVSPAPVGAPPSNGNGQYAAYLGSSTTPYQIGWSKTGYSALPSTLYAPDMDQTTNVFLPPADNVIADWGFENGNPAANWTLGGTVTPTLSAYPFHTGQKALQLGELTFLELLNVSNSATAIRELRTLNGPDNSTHALWLGDGGAYYAYRAPDGSWTGPELLSQAPANAQFYTPDLTLAANGTVYALWVQYVPGQTYVPYYRSRPQAGSWSTPQMVGNTQGGLGVGYTGWPQIAVDTNNIVHVAWANAFNDVVYFYFNGTTWSPIEYFHSSTWNRHMTDLIVGSNGGLHLLWWEKAIVSSGFELTRYAYRTPAGAWSKVEDYDMTSGIEGSCPPPQLGVQGNVAHIIYCNHEYAIQYRTGSGGSLSAPLRISATNLPSDPFLLAPATGGLYVAWNDHGTLTYRYRSPAGVWSPTEQPFGANGLSGQPTLALGTGGVLHVTWAAGEQDGEEIYYARRDGNGSWHGPMIVGYTLGASQGPWLAGEASDGGVHVLWNETVAGVRQVYRAESRLVTVAGDSTIAQQVTIPAGMANPTLSYLYRLGGAAAGTGLTITLDNGSGPVSLFSTSQNQSAWTHDWLDLSAWAGQTVTLTFGTNQVAGGFPVWAYLDEITVGSSYADLWLNLSGPGLASPGQTALFNLTYGNRGGVTAAAGQITMTLPAGLSFVSANPAPVSTNPLVWQVGAMPAGSGPFTIQLTLRAAAAVPNPSTVNISAVIAGPTELETANNAVTASVLIYWRTYLPLILR